MRLVLDTNVVLSALLWRGPPFHLFHAVGQREEVRLFTSAVLVTELAEVLNRPFAAKRLALLNRTALELVADTLWRRTSSSPRRCRAWSCLTPTTTM